LDVSFDFTYYHHLLKQVNFIKYIGKVTKVVGLTVEAEGIQPAVGEICEIVSEGIEKKALSEVVGFRGQTAVLMPLEDVQGIKSGSHVYPTQKPLTVRVDSNILGQVLDGLGNPLDKSLVCTEEISINQIPPNPLERKPIDKIYQTGIKVLDCLLTCGQGQRMGIFAGSGVGKSTLLGMIARSSDADVNVIGLVGERGREVKEFLENDLGRQGLEKSVVVVATSDQPALVRVKAAFVATAVAEYFRDKGKSVMLMMDSVTRFAMAQREIGLAVGEPPTTKGYTPSVFALLPKLLERAGNSDKGSITALYTVLVDGDDLNEPIADAVRGILDGHIVLSRDLAHSNHYPAVDVLQSVSRLMNRIVSSEEKELAGRVRGIISSYKQAEDLINIGAYNSGSNKLVDAAIQYFPRIKEFLQQDAGQSCLRNQALAELQEIMEEG
jgi:flagellum-specific ATP synthase